MPTSAYAGHEFEWNERKKRAHVAKHGLSFEEAVGIFDGAMLLHG